MVDHKCKYVKKPTARQLVVIGVLWFFKTLAPVGLLLCLQKSTTKFEIVVL